MPSRKLALLLAVGALLGASANITKLGLGAGWTPVAFLFWSMLGAGVCLMALAFAAGVKPRFNREGLLYALISGLISIAAPNLLGYAAIPHVGAGFVALSFAFPAILTYAMALSLRMERFAAVRAAGLLCGFLGIVTLALAKPQNAVSISPWAFAALAAPLFLAMGNIYRTRRWPADAAPLSLAPGMLLAGAALVGVFAAVFGFSIGAPDLAAPAAAPLIAQIASTTLTYALYFTLQKIAGPVYLSQIGSVGGVVGVGIAVLVLGEAAPPALLLATGMIVAGVVLVSRR